MAHESLNKEEKKIYEVIKEYLLNKPLSSIEDIVTFINYRLRLDPSVNKIMIESVIKSLIRNKLIQPGTKLIKENLLKLTSRKLVYETIKDNEGINISELIQLEGVSNHQVVWHLTFLEKYEFIRVKKFGNQKAYFLQQSDDSLDNLKYYLRHEKVKKILKSIENITDEITPTTIKQLHGMNFNTAKKYLEILDELDIVKKKSLDSRIIYILDKKQYTNALKTIKKSK